MQADQELRRAGATRRLDRFVACEPPRSRERRAWHGGFCAAFALTQMTGVARHHPQETVMRADHPPRTPREPDPVDSTLAATFAAVALVLALAATDAARGITLDPAAVEGDIAVLTAGF